MILNSDIDERLGDLSPGEAAHITGFHLEEESLKFLHRLYDIGFLLGEKLEVLNHAPISRDPISVKVKDSVYALRREDANLIQVKKLKP